MSGVRWTTAVGIAIGGGAGALAALLGSPQAPTRATSAPLAPATTASSASAPAPVTVDAPAPAGSAPAASATQDAGPSSDPAAAIASDAPAAPPSSAAAATTRAPVVRRPPALEPPATRDALLKAMLFCDQRRDFDECARAAEALEKGTAGPADLTQAKRFRRIALTHLVAQCEAGAPHACFVLAAKYRAGTELAASSASAEALESRGLELCRSRSAPECPAP